MLLEHDQLQVSLLICILVYFFSSKGVFSKIWGLPAVSTHSIGCFSLF